MDKKIQIFIAHYVKKEMIELNDMLVESVTFMEKVTHYPHETIVIYYSPDGSDNELFDRMPKNVKMIKDDRRDHPGSIPSMRNKAIDVADDYFVIIHNDVRVSYGWLVNLVADFKFAETMYGKRCIMSLNCVPYHYIPGIIEPKYPDFWERMRLNLSCLSIPQMYLFCKKYHFTFKNGCLYSTPGFKIKDTGHILLMFMSSKNCFDPKQGGIGYCDENFLSWGWDDSDWGIRALMADKKNLVSQSSLIGHLGSFTAGHPNFRWPGECDNSRIFINKWGKEMFDDMQIGKLWARLHKEQEWRMNTGGTNG